MKVAYEHLNSRNFCVSTTFDAGSSVEYNKWTPGIAHVMEHMLFLSISDMAPEDLNRRLSYLGCDSNAATHNGKVLYYVKGPVESVYEASALLKKILFDGNFNEGLFLKEKNVILEEERSCREDLVDCMYQKMLSFLCSGPMGVPIIGTTQSINSITLDELKEFYNTYYSLDKMLLTITGPESIDVDSIISIFGHNNGIFNYSEKAPNKHNKEKLIVVPDERLKEQVKLFIIHKIDVDNEFELLNLHLINQFFSSGMDSRLFEKVRMDKGLCYSIGGSLWDYKDIGWFMISSDISFENLNITQKLINSEIKKLLKGDITDEEFERAKNKLRSRIYSSTETVVGLNWRINHTAYNGRLSLDQEISYIGDVSKEDLISTIKKVFVKKNEKVFILQPVVE